VLIFTLFKLFIGLEFLEAIYSSLFIDFNADIILKKVSIFFGKF